MLTIDAALPLVLLALAAGIMLGAAIVTVSRAVAEGLRLRAAAARVPEHRKRAL